MGTGPAIDVRGLSKRYAKASRDALHDVTMSVPVGAWLALLGPNGSGKSTLLRTIATIESPSSGSARALGFDTAREAHAVRARLGVVFQSPSLDRVLSVRENLMLQGAVGGLTRADSKRRAEALADELALDDRLDDRVATLSGGLARRADLARALMNDPDLLLLDEPTAGLDPGAREAFLEAIRRRVDAGLTVVLSTHLFDEAARAGLVAMMHEGRVVAFGTPEELCGTGHATLRTDATWRHLLDETSLDVSAGSHEFIASGDPHDLARLSERIVSEGGRVTMGRATLADAYAARTDAPLIPGVTP